MTHCPTCGAAWAGKPVCGRCKTDFGSILVIQRKAHKQRTDALTAFQSGDARKMFRSANQAFMLMKSHENRKVLACSALMDRQFDLALNLWKSCDESNP